MYVCTCICNKGNVWVKLSFDSELLLLYDNAMQIEIISFVYVIWYYSMLELVNNNHNSKEDEPQGSSKRANEDPQQNPSGDPIVALKVSSNVEDSNY